MHISIDRTVHTTAFDKPVVDHWLERKIPFDTCLHPLKVQAPLFCAPIPMIPSNVSKTGGGGRKGICTLT